VNPDDVTADYLVGRPFAPSATDFDQTRARWKSLASDPGARYDDLVRLDASKISPTVTWGTNPGQSVGVDDKISNSADTNSLSFMGLLANTSIIRTKIDVAFIGSCTNGRLSDLREAAKVIAGRRVRPGVRAMVVPGSQAVRLEAEREGLHVRSSGRPVLTGERLAAQCALR